MARKKKAANGAGSVERRGSIWWGRVSASNKPRKRIPIPNSETMTEAQARRAARELAAEYAVGKIVFDDQARLLGAHESLTVRQAGDAWTSGELFERFGRVNGLRELRESDKVNRWTLARHVYGVKTRGVNRPAFGEIHVHDVSDIDVERVMSAQPKEHSSETRLKTYNRLSRLFDLVIFPLRLRKRGDTPVSKYLRPESDPDKLFCFLYPSEILALLNGRSPSGDVVIPVARRVYYARATYTGQRKGSLFAQTWKHADFDHGTLASFKTKTGTAQYFVADRGLMTLLEAWYVWCGKPGDSEPINKASESDLGCKPKRLAATLREDLKAVGITRAILFEEEAENVVALRAHDLRSTFCTWARRSGKSDTWISERTGHKLTGKMIDRYDRGAQTLADLEYEPFPDISSAIPELRGLRLATRLATTTKHTPHTQTQVPGIIVGAIGIEPTTPTVSR